MVTQGGSCSWLLSSAASRAPALGWAGELGARGWAAGWAQEGAWSSCAGCRGDATHSAWALEGISAQDFASRSFLVAGTGSSPAVEAPDVPCWVPGGTL